MKLDCDPHARYAQLLGIRTRHCHLQSSHTRIALSNHTKISSCFKDVYACVLGHIHGYSWLHVVHGPKVGHTEAPAFSLNLFLVHLTPNYETCVIWLLLALPAPTLPVYQTQTHPPGSLLVLPVPGFLVQLSAQTSPLRRTLSKDVNPNHYILVSFVILIIKTRFLTGSSHDRLCSFTNFDY